MNLRVETEPVRRCPACAERDCGRYWRTLNGWRLQRCVSCSMVYVSPRPTEETLLAAYALEKNEYDAFFGTADLDTECYLGSDAPWLAQKAREQLQRVHRALGRKGRILELGCGGGNFLEVAQAEGWETAGVDPGNWLQAPAKDCRLGIQRCSLFAARLEDASFDAVFMVSVLEHLADPERYLLRLQQLLKPGGLLFVSGLPNVESITIRLGIDRWIGGYPPLHLLFFSRRSARRMFTRLGFTDIAVRSYGVPETLLAPLFKRGRAERFRNEYVSHVYRTSLSGAVLRALRQSLYRVFDATALGSVLELSCFARGRGFSSSPHGYPQETNKFWRVAMCGIAGKTEGVYEGIRRPARS